MVKSSIFCARFLSAYGVQFQRTVRLVFVYLTLCTSYVVVKRMRYAITLTILH